MKTSILIAATVLLAPCALAHAQDIDPDTAYYTGQEDQREIDMDRQADRQIWDMQRSQQQKDREDTERANREADDFVREQQLQRMSDDLTNMKAQQQLRQFDDGPR